LKEEPPTTLHGIKNNDFIPTFIILLIEMAEDQVDQLPPAPKKRGRPKGAPKVPSAPKYSRLIAKIAKLQVGPKPVHHAFMPLVIKAVTGESHGQADHVKK
jgi:hypothetical protein